MFFLPIGKHGPAKKTGKKARLTDQEKVPSRPEDGYWQVSKKLDSRVLAKGHWIAFPPLNRHLSDQAAEIRYEQNPKEFQSSMTGNRCRMEAGYNGLYSGIYGFSIWSYYLIDNIYRKIFRKFIFS